MNETEAKAEFFTEVSAWGNLIGQRRAGQSETGLEAPTGDAAAEWRRAARVLRAGRLVYSYNYLFVFAGIMLIILALIGAFLMAQKVSGPRPLAPTVS